MPQLVEAFRKYQLSKEPGTDFVDPSIETIEQSLSPRGTGLPGDVNSFNTPLEFCGKSLQVARADARREAIELALSYVSEYTDARNCAADANLLSATDLATKPLILSGHQPELFHAGVWYKNFLLSHLASRFDGVAINFLVDNDLCRDSSIRVPVQNGDQVITEKVSFDRWRDPVPWEQRSVDHLPTLEAFPAEVTKRLSSVGIANPLVNELWPEVVRSVKSTGNLGRGFARARHLIELQDGSKTLEVPLSRLVSTRAFARFSIQLLSSLPRFQAIYNEQRDVYRAAHKIRNQAHPVPALEERDGWLEAPWWIYRPEAPTRQRLWVRMVNDQLILSDRAGWQEVIEGRLDCDNAATQWLEILSEGVRLRPRALLTTMYLRLFVSDLFVHGIGGGKYDQLTDHILHDYFELEPPNFAVATATLHLPIAQRVAASGSVADIETQIQALQHQLWESRYKVDKQASDSADPNTASELERLAEEKKKLLANMPPKGEKWEWHQSMSRINKQIRDFSTDHAKNLRQQIERLSSQLKQRQTIESREYSFCLFPREVIVPQLKRMAEDR